MNTLLGVIFRGTALAMGLTVAYCLLGHWELFVMAVSAPILWFCSGGLFRVRVRH